MAESGQRKKIGPKRPEHGEKTGLSTPWAAGRHLLSRSDLHPPPPEMPRLEAKRGTMAAMEWGGRIPYRAGGFPVPFRRDRSE